MRSRASPACDRIIKKNVVAVFKGQIKFEAAVCKPAVRTCSSVEGLASSPGNSGD
jgi:hypothetical protein